MLKVKVEGYAEAKKILDELPNNMQKRMLVTALRGSAKPMLASARSKVPVKSGKLKKQLKIVRYKDRQASKTEVAVAVKPVFEKTKKKGSVNEFYGKFIHEGTADPRVSKKGKMLVFENQQGENVFVKSVKGIKATPFLEQAYSDMKEITVKGRPLPIHFGMRAINEFTKRQEMDFEKAVTSPESLSNLDSIVTLAVSGLNEGARLAGKDDRYTEDDVWDMFDADPNLILDVSDAFIECVEPLTDKLGSLTDAKPRAKSSSLGLCRGAKEEGERSDPKNGKHPAAKPSRPRR